MNIQVTQTIAGPQADAARPAAIQIDHLTKSYKAYDKPFSFLKEVLSGRPYHREKEVLHDISLRIEHGEVVGVIGRNGAGKSTLLKCIAGTLTPTLGKVHVDGRIAAILELGTGFNSLYTGRENIIMSALMRGMSESEIARRIDGIIAFSGLANVIDEPFHTYSSGMQGRLAFAAAVSVDADIIIIDEALSTGDARFAAKSMRRIHDICASGVTALFVSHTTYFVMQLCTRAIWIDQGRIRMDGAPVEVVRAYEYQMHQEIAQDSDLEPEPRVSGAARQVGRSTQAVANAPTRREPATVGTAERVATAISNPHSVKPPTSGRPASTSYATPKFTEAGKPFDPQPHRFGTGQYKMVDVTFLDRNDSPTLLFRFGEPMKLQVSYECQLSELPKVSCGMAASFNRTADLEACMYFSTTHIKDEQDERVFFDAPYRSVIGRRGIIEAIIDPVQLRAGEYYVSIGIVPNEPGAEDFYDCLRCHCTIRILPNGFDEPAAFYPLVSWTAGP